MSQQYLRGGAVAIAMASAALLFSGLASAASDAALERRVEQLEQELAELKDTPQETDDAEFAGTQNEQFDGLLSNAEISFGGYVKFDAFYNDFSDGEGATTGDNTRAFYFPSRIPVGGGDGFNATDATARQSRVNMTVLTETGGHTIKGFVEIDFYGDAGTETVTNSAEARLRHAFLTYQHCDGCSTWLFGQTWSNYMILGAYPETLDFIGPAESIPFIRQPQVRATFGNLSLSLENPENQIDGLAGSEPEGDLPDVTVRYAMPTGFGLLAFSGLVRQITDEGLVEGTATDDDTAVGYGLSFGGRIDLGKDNVKWVLTHGDGLGRYVGIGLVNAAVLDGDDLETIAYNAGYVAFQHHWTSHWRSNLVVGTLQVDDEEYSNTSTAAEDASSAHVNLLYSPVPKLTFGVELMYAEVNLLNPVTGGDDDGDWSRVQFSAKLGI